MAPDVNVRKQPVPVLHDCCKTKPEAKICVCIVCDRLLHISCSEKRSFQSFGGVLGVCKPCDVNLTSSTPVLAQINDKSAKLADIVQKLTEENNKLKEKVNVTKQANTDLKEKLDERRMQHEREVEILNDLVSEIKDKNSLLVEKNKVLSEKNQELITKCTQLELNGQNDKLLGFTYAQVATNHTQHKYITDVSSSKSIIIKPKENQTAEETKNDIEHNLDLAALNVKVISVKKMNEGKVKVICCNKASTEKLKEEIHSTMDKKYEVSMEKLELPKIKIVGIMKKYDKDELEHELLKHNFPENSQKYLKVTHIKPASKNGKQDHNTVDNNENNEHTINKDDNSLDNKRTKEHTTYDAFVQLDPAYFHHIMQTGKIFIEWQRCSVYEDLNTKRCYKCSGYGHSSQKCNNNRRCVYCAGTHEVKFCKANQPNCCNCLEANHKYKTNRNTHHEASDYKKCETYKARLVYLRSKIDYTITT